MDVVYPRCAGLDVHQKTVVVCARVAEGARVQREVHTFGTTTGELLALAEWLAARHASALRVAGEVDRGGAARGR